MVTREDVENIALLSKLFVPEEELDGLTESMQKIVDFADQINSAPASDEGFDNINNLSKRIGGALWVLSQKYMTCSSAGRSPAPS